MLGSISAKNNSSVTMPRFVIHSARQPPGYENPDKVPGQNWGDAGLFRHEIAQNSRKEKPKQNKEITPPYFRPVQPFS
jgi:hypothetical protein